MNVSKAAILALEDGTIFRGSSIGADGETIGEIVFNTAMTGYQEILTDPSYAKQIVTLTYPHIGNTGITSEDNESDRIHAAGLVIRDLPLVASSWRSEQSLSDFLVAEGSVAIADIDTRKLTRILRDKGAQSACILAGQNPDPEVALSRALRHLSAFNRLAERQIHAGQNGWLPLNQQWESLHDYLQLEVRRLDRPITWNLLPPDPALAQCAIPSLVVQPLVENALWHGLGGTSCQGAGTVTVSATAEGDGHILIEVHNTPSPAPEYDPDPVRPEVSEPRRRHASDLIQQRLTLLDRSGKSGIEMNHNDAGTLARLVVPTKPA